MWSGRPNLTPAQPPSTGFIITTLDASQIRRQDASFSGYQAHCPDCLWMILSACWISCMLTMRLPSISETTNDVPPVRARIILALDRPADARGFWKLAGAQDIGDDEAC